MLKKTTFLSEEEKPLLTTGGIANSYSHVEISMEVSQTKSKISAYYS